MRRLLVGSDIVTRPEADAMSSDKLITMIQKKWSPHRGKQEKTRKKNEKIKRSAELKEVDEI